MTETRSEVATDAEVVLALRHVSKTFRSRKGLFGGGTETKAAVDVNLVIRRGETLALVGESGSGKTTVARLALRLHAPDSGTVEVLGKDITRLGEGALRPIRRHMTMVFQDPYTSLNPRHNVATILSRVLRNFRIPATQERLESLLESVGMAPEFLGRYPHEFSGGQRQRIGIARALATEPSLVIADEPVSALDVSVRAQVLNLLTDMRNQRNLALLIVAHDLAVVRTVADRVAVMYLGTIVEQGPAADLYRDPQHPYTQALLSAVPRPDPHRRRKQLAVHGEISTASASETSCPFAPRCPRAQDRCHSERPVLTLPGVAEPADLDQLAEHVVACHFPGSAKPHEVVTDDPSPEEADGVGHVPIIPADPVG